MNIIEVQESLKDLPDNALMQEMQNPTGSAPQFLVLSELKRRKRMRDDYQRRQAGDIKTVAEEAVTAAGAPQEGIMQVSRAMNPNSSIAQNTGMDQAMPQEPVQAPQMMADGGLIKMQQGGGFAARPGPMTGGVASAIAMLRENYPEIYEQYKDSPELEMIAAAAMSGMVAEDVPYSLDAFEAPRSSNIFSEGFKRAFTDPSNRAVTKKAAEIEAMQPELNAAAEAQRAAALEQGDESLFAEGSVAEYLRGTPEGGLPRKSEAYGISGTLVSPDVEDYIAPQSGGAEQSFVLQRPEGALLRETSTMGGDRPIGLDTSTFTQPIDVRKPIGDVYADPEKIRATEDAMMAGIGSLGGPLTLSEAAAETARQRIEDPISTQVEQPMLVDQMATASIPDDRSMEEEIRDQRERARMAEERRMDYLGPIVSDDTISSSLVDLGEAGLGFVGDTFEAGVDYLQGDDQPSLEEQITEASAIPEGFRLGDGTTAEGAFSVGDLLPKDTDTSTAPAGRKSTSTSGGTGGGVGGRIAQMLADREKSAEADKWMALAQAGMALMASDQPTFGGALGEAGLVGVGAMQKARKQYDDDIMDLLTLQQRANAASSRKSGGLTASNMISLMDDLRNYKNDIQDRINDLNDPTNMMSEEEKAAQLQRLQAELMRTDIELGTYRNALRGGGTGGSSFDVRGGSTQQPSVGYSLGTATQ